MRDSIRRLARAGVAAAALLPVIACSAAPDAPEKSAQSDEAIITKICHWPTYVDCEDPWDVPGHKVICQCQYLPIPEPAELALGQATAYMLGTDGGIYAWGAGTNYARGDGVLGDASIIEQPFLKNPKSQFSDTYSGVHVAAGDTGGTAILDDGTILQWGTVATLPALVNDPAPVIVAGLPKVSTSPLLPTQLAQGSHHACVISSVDQTVWCWGDNASGQLGDGTTTSRTTPAQVADENIVQAVAIAAAHDTTCILRSDHTVWCWGDNTNGSLGFGAPGGSSSTPYEARGSDVTWSAIYGGGSGTFCVSSNDVGKKLSCWGANAHGQVGTASYVPVNAPYPAANTQGKLQVAFGNGHACAGGSSGTAVLPTICYGENGAGQLGTGTTSGDSLAPVAPAPPAPITNELRLVAAGGNFTCGITKDGVWDAPDVICWGANDHGQLGRWKTPGTPAQPAPIGWYF